MHEVLCPEHETAVVEVFILPHSRDRFSSFLPNKKKRGKILERLAHQDFLDPKNMTAIPSDQQTAEQILKILQSKGAPALCCVISESSDLDGRHMELLDVLRVTVGFGIGTIISCIPGRLAYYEGEGKNERYLLQCNRY